MGIFKNRLPKWQDIFIVLGVIVFVVFSWSVRGFLFVFPSIVLRYATGEILAIFSYMMAFALVESLLIIGCLVLVSAALPRMWFREGFSYKGFLVVFVGSITSILYQSFLGSEFLEVKTYFLWVGVFILTVILLILLFHIIQSWHVVLVSIAERFTIFAYLYIPIGFIGLSVVIIRNLFNG